jgi:4-amino-4-deoxy-L-arabinose transferase-like glycosyltransferase
MMFVRGFGFGLGILGFAYLGACVLPRLGSPWPLEWMEGASLQHALRLWHGQPLYAAPSGEFIPFIYPPLAYWPMALSAALFGPELWAARLPSLLACGVSGWALLRAGRSGSGELAVGALAAGLYCFGYGYCGGFMDVARVDPLFIAFVLLGAERLCAAEQGERGDLQPLAAHRSELMALLWFVLASATKQHGLLFLVAASAYLLVRAGRSRLQTVAGAWLLLALGAGTLEYASGGWLSTYLVAVPRRHGLHAPLLLSFFLVDLWLYVPVLTLLALRGLVHRARHWRALDVLLLAGLIASALGRAHPGGDDNVRLPAYAFLALTAALEFQRWWLQSRSRSIRAALSGGVILQVAMLWQAPTLYAPSATTGQRFAELRAELARCAAGGSSVALDHAGLTARPFVHTQAWSDLVVNQDRLAAQADRAVLGALRAADAPEAIALSTTFPELQRLLDQHYVLCSKLAPLRLPTGYALGVTSVYRRKP